MYDHHVVTVSTQPGVHGFADATDFVQSWGMVIRPAKVQNLRQKEDNCHDSMRYCLRDERKVKVYLWMKLADVITLLTEVEELR